MDRYTGNRIACVPVKEQHDAVTILKDAGYTTLCALQVCATVCTTCATGRRWWLLCRAIDRPVCVRRRSAKELHVDGNHMMQR